MGCDINISMEYQDQKGTWIDGSMYKPNPYAGEEYEPDQCRVEPYVGRNYMLFSRLAGVRNHSGKTMQIAELRGIPDDVTSEVKANYESWCDDAHSTSWLTLKEIEDFYEANRIVTYSGLISKEQAKALDEEGIEPNSWCQDTTMDYVRREWESEDSSISNFLEQVRQYIEISLRYDYGAKENSEKIRFVFWFDN